LKLLSADFVTSAAAGGTAHGIPHDGLPQIVFAGRSNVGKSSLLNALCRRTIARTSAAPGKTRLVNIYRAWLEGGPGGPGRWSVYLVDLPGYGYARGGADAAAELRATSEAYFATVARTTPAGTPDARGASAVVGTLLLIDSRHPGLESDVVAAGWLAQLGTPWHVVGTKIDKLSRAERARNLRELERTFGTAALPVSAESGEGLDELWQMIANLVRR
jgi:GTP-binding protein